MAKIRIEGTIDIGDREVNTSISKIKANLGFMYQHYGNQGFEGIIGDDDVIQAERDAKMVELAKEFSSLMSKIFCEMTKYRRYDKL